MKRNTRRLRRASFGPEWEPFGHFGSWLLRRNASRRERDRFASHYREACRELAREEAKYL